jgi:sulfoacetaldehyde dehydrogenase
MGCGTWGRNHLSENLTFRNFLNITRVVTPIVRREPRVDQLLAGYFERHGR